ncbi:MAG: hypothetical protein DSY32_03055 [Aquifex sp.]|nr:MAG: hypothetical protein DSY32_03055 [Aquifex sp.]
MKINPLVLGYAEVFELDRFLELLSHLLRSKIVEREFRIEYFRDGTAHVEVEKDRVLFPEKKKKLVATKFMENFKKKKYEELLKRRERYIFVWDKNEIGKMTDFLEFAIKELINLSVRIERKEESIYMEIIEEV